MKIKAAVIGSGNIGTDLLYKALRSKWIDPVWMVGIDPNSEGLGRAKKLGLKTTHNGVVELAKHLVEDDIKIAFDATSASVHQLNDEMMQAHGVSMIDLTPAAIGPYCIPPVNLTSQMGKNLRNVNMVTCGGQATIPMVAAVSRIQSVDYGEIVATVASKSIGPGTRQNIDEFTQTTARAIESVGNAKKGKAIIVVNPAEPPLIMRDTIHCLTSESPNQEAINRSVHQMVEEVQTYVPGYKLKNGPIYDGNRVSIFMEVKGLGDFLPIYAGNLDIMTAAALKTAETMAQDMLEMDGGNNGRH